MTMELSSLIRFAHAIPDDSQVLLDCYHTWGLVALSYTLACAAAGTTLSLVGRVTEARSGRARHCWAFVGSVCMSIGIWTMHFTAMKAFQTPIPMAFDSRLTALSLLLPILLCHLALTLFGKHQSLRRALLASLLIGSGIVLMHYSGMAAIRMSASLYYELPWFLLSVVIAVGAALAALLLVRALPRLNLAPPLAARLLCSAVMGGAIAGMHYSAMAGTVLVVDRAPADDRWAFNASTELGVVVALAGLLVMAMSIVISEILKRLEERDHHLNEVNDLVASLERARSDLEEVAWRDPVTRLGNRHSLNRSLEEIIAQDSRGDTRFSLLFLDVDDFKSVNDSLGHASGDLLLRDIAKRLTTCLRPTDQISRFGGDEFVLILLEEQNFSLEGVAGRILRTMERPFSLPGATLSVSISIGAARYPADGATASELLRSADTALYRAKLRGKNRFAVFDRHMYINVNRRLQLENGLRGAIEGGDIQVHYQPIVDIASGAVSGLEALARWRYQGEDISPVEFIPLAEQNGTIVALGQWVLNRALADLRVLLDEGLGPLTLSINLSAMQFQDEALTGAISRALGEHRVSGEVLRVEVTESCLIQDLYTTSRQLASLKRLGIGISIDDFGSGYSSLSCLKRLPFDELKVDRSLIIDLPHNLDDVAICESIVAMARRLGIKVVIEGVETADQARFFFDSRQCDYLQGYLFSRPLPLEGIRQLLAQRQGQAATSDWPAGLAGSTT